MSKKKVLEGYLSVEYEDTCIASTLEEAEKNRHSRTGKLVIDELEGYHGKKIRITIEEIDEK